MKTAVTLVASATVLGVASAGFDWGAGCAGGSGKFTTTLAKGEKVTVGSVPQGLWNVQVQLTATADVDLQLYDAGATAKWSEGAAIVAWTVGIKIEMFTSDVIDDLRYAGGAFTLIFVLMWAHTSSLLVASLAYLQIVAALGVA